MNRPHAESSTSTALVLILTALSAGYAGYLLRAGREDVRYGPSQYSPQQEAQEPGESGRPTERYREEAPRPESVEGRPIQTPFISGRERDSRVSSRSGLEMVSTGGVPLLPIGKAARAASPAKNLAQAIRAHEPRVESLARRYTEKYPVIRRYGRDWMSYSDLRRYNDQYFRDRDPVKFAWNVAASPNFAALMAKYARKSEILAFVGDVARTAPVELLNSVQVYLNGDRKAEALLERFSKSLGLPDGLMAAVSNKSLPLEAAAQAVLKSDPRLKQALDEAGVDSRRLENASR